MCLFIYQQINFYESIKALDFTFIYLEEVALRTFFIASIMNALAVIISVPTNCHFKNSHYFLWTRPFITIISLYILLHLVFRKTQYLFHGQNCSYPQLSFTFLPCVESLHH